VATGSAGTNGILFCDLRGYAAFVDARGDHAAAELLAAYRALVREAVASHEGAEIRTEGDSVYVVFPTASAAVEAGLAIVAAAGEASTPELPVRVGVGIHAGETLATGEGPVGGAVNIAARVCARAEAGEVLVTDTVRAITRTLVPYAFVPLGTQQLKGIRGGVALYRVETVPASRAAHLRRRLAARRGRVALAVAAVAVLVVAGAAAWSLTRPADCLVLGPETRDVVAKIDPVRGCVVATYPVGHRPSHILSAGGRMWVANAGDRTVTALDASTGVPFATVGVGGASSEPITAISAGADALHVLDGDLGLLTTVDLKTAAVLGMDKLPGEGEGFISFDDFARLQDLFPADQLAYWFTNAAGEYAGIAEDQGHVWVSNRRTGQLVRDPLHRTRLVVSVFLPREKGSVLQVDPAVDLVRKVCNAPYNSRGRPTPCLARPSASRPYPGTSLIAFVGSMIWAAHEDSPELSAYDRDSGVTTHMTPAGAAGRATGLATEDGDLWVAYEGGQVAHARVPSVTPVAASVAPTLTAIAADPSGVYVATGDGHQVLQIDPSSLAVLRTIDVGGRADGVAVAPDGSVWVTVSALDGE
jgi:class 3 adenylate cyclase